MNNNETPVNNLVKYLKVPSVHPNPNYEECLKVLLEIAEGAGLVSSEVRPAGKPILLLTRLGTQPNLPSILLNSHMDVVPVFREKWTHEPFGAEKVDGKIYARGAQDTKAIGIQYIEAMRRIKEPLKRTVHISFVPDEEIGGVDGMKSWVQTEEFRKLNIGFALDEGCAFPKEEIVMFSGERTHWVVVIDITGTTGHGSLFHLNTCGEKLSTILTQIMEFRAQQAEEFRKNPLSWPTTCTSINLTRVQGGVADNVLPDNISLTLDIRLAPSLDFDKFEHWLQDVCMSAGEGVTLRYKAKDPKYPSTAADSSNPFWAPFTQALDKMNQPAMFVTCPGVTDARYLRQAGVYAFGFAPLSETPTLAHAHDEYIREDKFITGIDIYVEVIKAITSV